MTTYGRPARWVDPGEIPGALPSCLCAGRLVLDGTMGRRYGGCVRVHEDWILTAHHVVDIPDIARRFTVRFNGAHGAKVEYRLDPDRGYFPSHDGILSASCIDFDLDYVFVRLAGPAARGDASRTHPALIERDAPAPGEPLQIPQAAGLDLALKFPVERTSAPASVGRAALCEGPYLHHQVSTRPGASGSPVFDTRWHVVALHTGGRLDNRPSAGLRHEHNLATLMDAIVADARARHPAFPDVLTFAG